MVRLSKAEFLANVERLVDQPLPEPIRIPDAGASGLVVMAEADYQRLTGERRVLLAGEVSDDDLALIAAAEVPAEYAHLDAELESGHDR